MIPPYLSSPRIAFYHPTKLRELAAGIGTVKPDDVADATAALAYLQSFVVKAPRHRLRRGWTPITPEVT